MKKLLEKLIIRQKNLEERYSQISKRSTSSSYMYGKLEMLNEIIRTVKKSIPKKKQ